ncbi:MAG: hypothetical protein VB099_00915 [Candidatus Limiplasma sp.]|nr:hypothetical protein [Candidatus Limiplasma sp.]
MKRFPGKFPVRLLCVLLALLLPLSSLAQGTAASSPDGALATEKTMASTMTFTPGEALRAIPAVADLLEALSFRLVAPGDGMFSMGLFLSGEEAMSFALRAQEEGLYLQSEAMGGKALFFGWEDLRKGLQELDVEDLDMHSALQSFDSLRDALTGESLQSNPPPENVPQEWDEALLQVLGEDEASRRWVEDVRRRLHTAQGYFTAPGHDPATRKTEFVVTQEDWLALLDTSTVRENVAQQLALTEPSLSGPEKEAEIDRLLAEVREVFRDVVLRVPITLLEQNGELVSLSIPLTVDEADGSLGFPQGAGLDMPMTYRRLTLGETRTHSFQTKISSSYIARAKLDAVLMEKAGDWEYKAVLDNFTDTQVILKGGVKEAEGACSLYAVVNGREAFGLEALSTHGDAEDALDVKLLVGQEVMAFFLGSPAPVSATGGLEHLLTFHVRSAALEEQAGPFAIIRQADLATSVQPLTMNEEELSVFFEKSLTTHFLKAAFKLMSLMPSSVMELMTQDIDW